MSRFFVGSGKLIFAERFPRRPDCSGRRKRSRTRSRSRRRRGKEPRSEGTKTEICCRFLQNRCSRSSKECWYAHDMYEIERTRRQPPTKTEIDYFLSQFAGNAENWELRQELKHKLEKLPLSNQACRQVFLGRSRS